MSGFLYAVVILAIVLGVLVFVHELGHYLAAKLFGVWVHRFAIGIGKPVRALSFQRGETEYAIAWLPLGGYVKMASREEDPASGVLEGGAAADVPADRVFEAKPIWQRMIIILSGVTLNTLFAWLVFSGLAWKNGHNYDPTTTIGRVNAAVLPPEAKDLATVPSGATITTIDDQPIKSWSDIGERLTNGDKDGIQIAFANHPPVLINLKRDALAERGEVALALEPMQTPVVGSLLPNYPGIAAGLQVGDSIVSVDGAPISQWTDAVTRIRGSAGKELDLEVIRAGQRHVLKVTPREEREISNDSNSALIGRIGATAKTAYRSEPVGFFAALKVGADESLSAAGTIFRTLRGLLNRQVSTKQLGGPILIGTMAAQQARLGLDNLLAFMALISINLAVVNLLPIPVLDGGAFLILALEGVIRRPLPARLREAVTMVGLVIVVFLMALAFKNDIWRWLGR